MVNQADLGIKILLSLFSKNSLQTVFNLAQEKRKNLTNSSIRMLHCKNQYLRTIETVISFLQTKESSLAYLICQNLFLPQGHGFNTLPDLDQHFGDLGVVDKARYLSTLYLEEISDLIKEVVSPHFGFSRYGERLAVAATSYDPIETSLNQPNTIIDDLLELEVARALSSHSPDIVGFTVPFPGCLIGTLKASRFIKHQNPDIKIILGGGYVSTELREISDRRIFNDIDYLCLDQGEIAIKRVIDYISGNCQKTDLKKTFLMENQSIIYIQGEQTKDIPFTETGYPDYSDLNLNDYLSIIEIPNAMHRLWNDGRWNKMQIATGCYWQKCAFCDVSLDYIKNYSTVSAKILVDRIERIIKQTGQTGFHFVDEAAPPNKLKELALELLKRNLVISWWSNIRFEKAFSADLCKLLSASGCIAVSGGLETVTDRLLKLMNKGVNLQQAIQSLHNFRQAGILVHTYLMYGFPTQTEQETIDSLEMVRQLFCNDLIQSCYWHRFTLTAHSKISADPKQYKISIAGPDRGSFAWNDLIHHDPTGCDHDHFEPGLKKAVYNFMLELGLEEDLNFWFEFDVPSSIISPDYVQMCVDEQQSIHNEKPGKQLLWLNQEPVVIKNRKQKKQKNSNSATLRFYTADSIVGLKSDERVLEWLVPIICRIFPESDDIFTVERLIEDYEATFEKPFTKFQSSHLWQELRENGLLII